MPILWLSLSRSPLARGATPILFRRTLGAGVHLMSARCLNCAAFWVCCWLACRSNLQYLFAELR